MTSRAIPHSHVIEVNSPTILQLILVGPTLSSLGKTLPF